MKIIPVDPAEDGRTWQARYLAGQSRTVVQNQQNGDVLCICLGHNHDEVLASGSALALDLNGMDQDNSWDFTNGPKYRLLDHFDDVEAWGPIFEQVEKASEQHGELLHFVDGSEERVVLMVFKPFVDLVSLGVHAKLESHSFDLAFLRELQDDMELAEGWIEEQRDLNDQEKDAGTGKNGWLHQALRVQFMKELDENPVLKGDYTLSDVVVFRHGQYFLQVRFNIPARDRLRARKMLHGELRLCYEAGMGGQFQFRPTQTGDWPI
jgi:hypothetical protein